MYIGESKESDLRKSKWRKKEESRKESEDRRNEKHVKGKEKENVLLKGGEKKGRGEIQRGGK